MIEAWYFTLGTPNFRHSELILKSSFEQLPVYSLQFIFKREGILLNPIGGYPLVL